MTKTMKRIPAVLLAGLIAVAAAFAVGAFTAQEAYADEPHTHAGITFQPWTETTSLPSDPGNYFLTDEVKLNSGWMVNGTINLCLNGHGIRLNAESGSVIDVGSGATLNIYDCKMSGDGATPHKYTISTETTPSGLAIVDDTLTGNYHTFNGGYITGGKGTTGNYTVYGGGIYIDGGGTVNMYGGTIIGNTAGQGGGIYNIGTLSVSNVSFIGNTADFGGGICHGSTAEGVTDRTFTMDSVYIRENKATLAGGGIYAVNAFTMNDGAIIGNTSDQGGGVYNITKFNMKGGEIGGNTATKTGGGVYNSTFGEFAMSGGTISENTAGANGGGVYNMNRFSLSGSPKIAGNTANGKTDNAYLAWNLMADCQSFISITQQMTEGASIGVTMERSPGVFANAGAADLTLLSHKDYFSSDNGNYIVSVSENTLRLESKPTYYYVSFDPNGGTGEMERIKVVGGKVTLPENGFTAPEGCYFGGWEDPDGVVYQPGTEYKTTRSVTMKAKWVEKLPTTIDAKSITKTYNGKKQVPDFTVTGSTAEPMVTYYDRYKNPIDNAPVNAGTYYYKVSVPEDERYLGAETEMLKITINKAAQKFKSIKYLTKSYGKPALVRSARKFRIKSKLKQGKGAITYTKIKGDERLTIDKYGKVFVEKSSGYKKGKTYKMTIKVTAAETSNYKALSVKKTVKVKVKN